MRQLPNAHLMKYEPAVGVRLRLPVSPRRRPSEPGKAMRCRPAESFWSAPSATRGPLTSLCALRASRFSLSRFARLAVLFTKAKGRRCGGAPLAFYSMCNVQLVALRAARRRWLLVRTPREVTRHAARFLSALRARIQRDGVSTFARY